MRSIIRIEDSYLKLCGNIREIIRVNPRVVLGEERLHLHAVTAISSRTMAVELEIRRQ